MPRRDKRLLTTGQSCADGRSRDGLGNHMGSKTAAHSASSSSSSALKKESSQVSQDAIRVVCLYASSWAPGAFLAPGASLAGAFLAGAFLASGVFLAGGVTSWSPWATSAGGV